MTTDHNILYLIYMYVSQDNAAAATETGTPVLDYTAIAGTAQPVPIKLVILGAVLWSLENDGCLIDLQSTKIMKKIPQQKDIAWKSILKFKSSQTREIYMKLNSTS